MCFKLIYVFALFILGAVDAGGTTNYTKVVAKCAEGQFDDVTCDEKDDFITKIEGYYGEPSLLTKCNTALRKPFDYCTALISESEYPDHYRTIQESCMNKTRCDPFPVLTTSGTKCTITSSGHTEYTILKIICSKPPNTGTTHHQTNILSTDPPLGSTQTEPSQTNHDKTPTRTSTNATDTGNSGNSAQAADTGSDIIVVTSVVIVVVILIVVIIVVICEVRRRKERSYRRAVHTVMSLRHQRQSDALIADDIHVNTETGIHDKNATNSGSILETSNTWDSDLNRGNGRVNVSTELDPDQLYEDPNFENSKLLMNVDAIHMNAINTEEDVDAGAIYANTPSVDVNIIKEDHSMPRFHVDTAALDDKTIYVNTPSDPGHEPDLPLYGSDPGNEPDLPFYGSEAYSLVNKSRTSTPQKTARLDQREAHQNDGTAGVAPHVATQLSLEGTSVVENTLYESNPKDAQPTKSDPLSRGVMQTQISLKGTNVVDNVIYESSDSADVTNSDVGPLTSRARPKLAKMARVDE